jgi:hypothetical protein
MVHRKSSIFLCDCSALHWLPRNYAKNTSAVSGGGGGNCGSGSWWLTLFAPPPPAPALLPPVSAASYVARRVFAICIFQQQVIIERSCSNCIRMNNHTILNSLERTSHTIKQRHNNHIPIKTTSLIKLLRKQHRVPYNHVASIHTLDFYAFGHRIHNQVPKDRQSQDRTGYNTIH